MNSIFTNIILVVLAIVGLVIALWVVTAVLSAFEAFMIAIWPFLLAGVAIYVIYKMFFDK